MRGGVGAPGMGPWAPRLLWACSFLFSSSVHRRPRLRPLTSDPPLLPRGAVAGDPDLWILRCQESEPEWPLRSLQGARFQPCNCSWKGSGATETSLEGPSDPSPTPGSRLGPQSPPLAAWSLIPTQAGVPPAHPPPPVFPSPPLAAVTGGRSLRALGPGASGRAETEGRRSRRVLL